MTSIHSIHSDAAPAAIGPYSQAIVHGGLVYCSGQIALDPVSGSLVGDDAATQADRCLENLKQVLRAAKSGVDRILKVTIYLADMSDFQSVNEVYGRHLGVSRPARVTIAAAGLPKGALVEMDCIAATAAS